MSIHPVIQSVLDDAKLVATGRFVPLRRCEFCPTSDPYTQAGARLCWTCSSAEWTCEDCGAVIDPLRGCEACS